MESLEVALEGQLEGIALHHPSAQAAVGELRADLASEQLLQVRERDTASTGTKGATVDVVVTLGASSSVGALVKIIQLWLSRDRRRSLIVTVQKDTEKTVVKVEGDPISLDTLTDALNSAAKLDKGAASG